MLASKCFVAAVITTCLLVSEGCTSWQSAETQQQVTFVSSPNLQHVAVLMWTDVHGIGRAWAWYEKLPMSGTSLVVLDNDPPHTLGSKNAPIVYRRVVFLSACKPEDFSVRWSDDNTVSIAMRCPRDKFYPSGTPANGINVTYTGQ